jgi:hypothetical protein
MAHFFLHVEMGPTNQLVHLVMACHETPVSKAHNDQGMNLPAPNKLGGSFDALWNKAIQIVASGAPKTTKKDILSLLSHNVPSKVQ